jgi:flavin reductase (DIM6/NTAB) family NADH-FMN oxidoreductase RutF
MEFKSIEIGSIPTAALHAYLLGSVAPRPIAFASTIDKEGNPNLSPFSFFNVFGSNPPIAIFSPARRVRDNSIKHTLENVLEVPEVVINVVDYAIVHQMSLSSCEYPKSVNEFEKAGFTAIPSENIRPFRVKESPVQLECKVKEVIYTGTEGGAGNLIVCEVVKIHVATRVLNAEGKIDQQKIDLVGRLGGDWYVRASGNALFEVEKPNTKLGIGMDKLPKAIRESTILTGNQLAQLANVSEVPLAKENSSEKQGLSLLERHQQAAELLSKGLVEEAWQFLL